MTIQIRRGLLLAAVLGWALMLTGCGHRLAQRSTLEWTAVRVLPGGDASVATARPEAVDRGGWYFLAREWRRELAAPSDGLDPPRLQRVRLEAGELIGFTHDPQGRVLAVAGNDAELLRPSDEVHYVWYRRGSDLTDAGALVGGVLLGAVQVVVLGTVIVGLVLLDGLSYHNRHSHGHGGWRVGHSRH